MGYDMYFIRIKKDVLNKLKKDTKLYLTDLVDYGFLKEDYINQIYGEDTMYEITSCNDIFKTYFKEQNIKFNSCECIEISFNQILEMRLWLENYLKSTLFEELDEIDSYDISNLFDLLKQLNNFILKLKKDDVILFADD